MARRKKPEGETTDQATTRRTLESISNHATRSEKVSWNRMMDNMVGLLTRLKPIEDKIIKLQADKMPLIDEVQALRQRMVRECVHPYEQLVLKPDGTVQCKFCNHTFRVAEG